jgi:hypothetical protein
MQANVRVEDGRVLVSLDIPAEQASLYKVEEIFRATFREATNGISQYPKQVCDNPTSALADMFRNIESQDVLVTDVHFPTVAQSVIEAHKDFKDGKLWDASCTFTHEGNFVVVTGGGIQIRVPWE